MDYSIINSQQIDSPALLVFPKIVKENIAGLVAMADDITRLRPHIKTHKTAEGIQLMMAAGIRKFKCATIAEAELLGTTGAPDVILAYQPSGPKLLRLVQLIKKFPLTKFACLTDNSVSAAHMAEVFLEDGIVVDVYIDINNGMNRTGISPGDDAVALYEYISGFPSIRLMGLHVYDGHIRQPDINERKVACDKAFEAVEQMVRTLTSKGFQEPIVVAGGSPTFPIHIKRKKIECSPGTCIFWDKGYKDLCAEQPFEPAAILITRVISLPAAGRVTLDLGHKSVASENEITRRVFFPDAQELKPVGQSEEHLVLEAGENHTYKVGDLLYGIPYHICPTVSQYERLICIENGEQTGEWKVLARDRRIFI